MSDELRMDAYYYSFSRTGALDAERARAEMAEQTRDGLQKRVRELEAELEAAHYALVDAT